MRAPDLRSTCATILLMAGKYLKHVQQLPGYANISITPDTYSHIIKEMGSGLGGAMEEAI